MVAHYEIIESEFVPLATVKKALKKRKKSELTYEQKMTLENAEAFSKLKESSSNKIIKELRSFELRKLKEEFITKIADMAPNNLEKLKLILAPSKISFKDEELKQILDVVKKNAK